MVSFGVKGGRLSRVAGWVGRGSAPSSLWGRAAAPRSKRNSGRLTARRQAGLLVSRDARAGVGHFAMGEHPSREIENRMRTAI